MLSILLSVNVTVPCTPPLNASVNGVIIVSTYVSGTRTEGPHYHYCPGNYIACRRCSVFGRIAETPRQDMDQKEIHLIHS
jgi:hypothetical protein